MQNETSSAKLAIDTNTKSDAFDVSDSDDDEAGISDKTPQIHRG